MEKTKPPEEIRKAAEKIRGECVRRIVARYDIFPPDLLSLVGGAANRVEHLTWVLRYRIAHREVTGMEWFRGSKGKRIISYEWAGWETETLPRQIEGEIKTIYHPDDDPQRTFQNHLRRFVEVYEEHESLC